MKKSILYLLVATCTSFSAKAQYIDATKVPQTIRNAFEKQHPGITPQWELEDGKFDAEFKDNDKKRSILFDRKGNSFEKLHMKIEEVPPAMTAYIQTNYNGAKLKKARKLVASNGSVTYLGAISGKILYFDEIGKFIEEKVDQGNGD